MIRKPRTAPAVPPIFARLACMLGHQWGAPEPRIVFGERWMAATCARCGSVNATRTSTTTGRVTAVHAVKAS